MGELIKVPIEGYKPVYLYISLSSGLIVVVPSLTSFKPGLKDCEDDNLYLSNQQFKEIDTLDIKEGDMISGEDVGIYMEHLNRNDFELIPA